MRVTICIVFLLVATISALGEVTGNQILDHCQKAIRFSDNNGAPSGEHFDAGWCIGWVNSALSLTQLENEWSDFNKSKPTLLQFCVPKDGIPVIQGVRIVVKYLNAHPEQLHENGMGLTLAALRGAFPCSG